MGGKWNWVAGFMYLGKGLIRDVTMLSNKRIIFDFFVLVYLAYILLSYNTDQAFMKAHFRPSKFLGLFMYTTVPCSLTYG
jgi:hypothetical protein